MGLFFLVICLPVEVAWKNLSLLSSLESCLLLVKPMSFLLNQPERQCHPAPSAVNPFLSLRLPFMLVGCAFE